MSALRSRTANAVASTVALVLLVALVTAAAEVLSPWAHFWQIAVAGYLFTVPLAIAAWTGVLFRRKGEPDIGPLTWRQWISVFGFSALLSLAFVLIDVLVKHPGISLVLTLGAISMTLISLPSAVRAWLLDTLSVSRSHNEPDA